MSRSCSAAPLWNLLADLRYTLYFVTTPAAPGLVPPAGPGDRWVYGPGQSSDVVDPRALDRAWLRDAIREGAGVADLDPHIERIGEFHSPGQLAERFRRGRTFLVGDAAHRVTPRGGTGMNTALQSGYDLGWKLGWVLRGWADPDLLDTYERCAAGPAPSSSTPTTERRVVAEHNIVRSTDPNGSRRPVVDELSVDLGGRVAHAGCPRSPGVLSTLDLLGPGWTLFTGPDRDAWDAAGSSSGAPVVVRAARRGDGAHRRRARNGALLVRPDGVPVAVWTSSTGAAELGTALTPTRGRLEISPSPELSGAGRRRR